MSRAALVVAVLAASAALAVLREASPVFACSGPPAWQQMAYAEAIFEGRVVSVRHLPERDDVTYRVFELVLQVEVPHLNSEVGQEFAAEARLPKPVVPVMCPQFETTEEFTGRYLVTSLHDRTDGPLILDRWSTPFIGDEPSGPDYDRAQAMARLAARTDPTGPTLDVEPATPRCGDLVVIGGSRFPPDTDVKLTYPGIPGGVATPFVVHTDASGMFGAKVKIWESACGDQLGFVEAWASTSAPYGDATIPLAIFPLSVGAAREPGPPDAGAGLAIIPEDRELPWNDVVMVVILLLAFAGGTAAIVRSSRRRSETTATF
jgi:hypothetical protein